MSVLKPSDDAIGFIVQTMEDAMCEEDEYIGEQFSAVEDAICELDEMLNGGK